MKYRCILCLDLGTIPTIEKNSKFETLFSKYFK